MLISEQHNFIFIHIWKVAGTSVSKALAPYAYNPDSFLPKKVLKKAGLKTPTLNKTMEYIKPGWFFAPHYATLNIHAKASKVKNYFSPEEYDRFFKFAFVRNPWDWQVSQYRYMMQKESHFQHEQVKAMSSFEDFLEWRLNDKLVLQKDFVTDNDGKLIVDFIGKYENLNQDFDTICSKIGIDASLPYLNTSRDKTQSTSYREYYSDRAIELVAQYCQPDIELFGYSFDG